MKQSAQYKIRAVMLFGATVGLSACAMINGGNQPATGNGVQLTIDGALTYRERIALPRDAVAIVRLEDVSIADRAAPILAERMIETNGRQVPIPFSLDVDRNEFTARGRYSVRGVIRDSDDALLWTTDTANLIDPSNGSVDLGALNMVRATASGQSANNSTNEPIVFTCGNERVEIRSLSGGRLKLSVGDQGYTLQQVRAASGAKYESVNPEEGVMFWEKGDRALLEIGDRSYPECEQEHVMATSENDQLQGSEWVVEDIAGKGVMDYSRATLVFSGDGQLSGNASCNQYSTTYTVNGDQLTLGPIAATKKACVPALMNQENAFFNILNDANKIEIGNNGALIVSTSTGAMITARR